MPRMRKLDLERRKLAEDGGICFFFLTIGNEVENRAKWRNAMAQAPQCSGPAQCGLRWNRGGLLPKSPKSSAPILSSLRPFKRALMNHSPHYSYRSTIHNTMSNLTSHRRGYSTEKDMERKADERKQRHGQHAERTSFRICKRLPKRDST